MLNKILTVTEEKLNNLDMSYHKGQAWFDICAGQEHYRLLAYIGSLFNDQILLDIGSYRGDSAAALAYNASNIIFSFDVTAQPEIKDFDIINIDFRIGDILEMPQLIKSAPFIILDTYHDGSYEAKFIQTLNDIEYKGLVLFDDILLNGPMRKMWADIPNEKYDLSHIGHHSGTGLAVWK